MKVAPHHFQTKSIRRPSRVPCGFAAGCNHASGRFWEGKKLKSKQRKATLLAWKTILDNRHGKKQSLLLRAIGRAIHNATYDDRTARAHHYFYKFGKKIADHAEHIGIAALRYNLWHGRWYVSNDDLESFAGFRMWLNRFKPEDWLDWTSSISGALTVKRMQQAYDRYLKTGLTKEHCKLLAAACWEIDTSRGDWISLFVQGKRPFGDSGRVDHIHEILGWPTPWHKKDESAPNDAEERAWNLFDELAFAAPDAAKVALKKLTRANRRNKVEV